MYAVLWWTVFTCVAVWAQYFVPGVDFFVPALVVCLQKGKNTQAGWLAAAWILILEGVGAMSFGFAVLWFGLLICLYLAGCWIFESRNFLFMCLMGIAAGLLHYGLILTIARLQDTIPASMDRLLVHSVVQGRDFPAGMGGGGQTLSKATD